MKTVTLIGGYLDGQSMPIKHGQKIFVTVPAMNGADSYIANYYELSQAPQFYYSEDLTPEQAWRMVQMAVHKHMEGSGISRSIH